MAALPFVTTYILVTMNVLASAAFNHLHESSSPTPAECSSVIAGMAGCLEYMIVGSNETQPVASCCTGFQSALHVGGKCICLAMEGTKMMGFEYNMTRVLSISQQCQVTGFSVSECGVSISPTKLSARAPPKVLPPSPTEKLSSSPSPSPSPKGSSDCSVIAYDMMDCLQYLAIGGDDSRPSDSCCSGFQSVVNADPHCVCAAMGGAENMGIDLNMTRVSAITPACKISGFSANICGVSLHPSPAPTPAHKHPTPAPAPSPSPSSDCSIIAYDMMDCLQYLAVGSKELKPSDTCCSGFKTVLKANPECVCVAMEGAQNMGIELNMTRVSKATSICKISGFSISHCPAKPPSTKSPVHPSPPNPKSPPDQKPKEKPPAPAKGKGGSHKKGGAPSISISLEFFIGLLVASSSFILM